MGTLIDTIDEIIEVVRHRFDMMAAEMENAQNVFTYLVT